MTDCPTCGQKVDELDRPLHDAARRLVTFNGKIAELSWGGNLIFEILLCRHPKTTHWERGAAVVWAGQDVDIHANWKTQTCIMRKALKPLGIRIATHQYTPIASGFYWLEW